MRKPFFAAACALMISVTGCLTEPDDAPALGSESHELSAFLIHLFPAAGNATSDVVLRGSRLYWSRDNAIQSITTSGSSLETYCNPCGDGTGAAAGYPVRIALDASNAVYYVAKVGSQFDVAVYFNSTSLPIFLGTAAFAGENLVMDALSNVTPILVDSQYVYFAVANGTARTVYRMPKAGGARQAVYTGPANVIFTGLAQSNTSCCSNSKLFVANGTNLISVKKASPFAQTVLTTSATSASSLTVSGSLIYWYELNNGRFKRASSTSPSTPVTLTGCASTTVVSSMTKDASFLYYTSLDGTVKQCSVTSGSPTVLYTTSTGPAAPRGIVTSAGWLYWGEGIGIIGGF